METVQAVQPANLEINGVPVIVAPPQWTTSVLRDLATKAHAQAPANIVRTQVVRNNLSFKHYDDRFSVASTLYLIDRDQHRVTALLDYHVDPASPSRTDHQLVRIFTHSKPFAAWLKNDRKPMNQRDFADFLEDRVQDLSQSENAEVSQADLMTAVLQFRANQNSTCTSATNLVNGDVELQFSNATNVISSTFPTKLLLDIPVFEFGRHWQIGARLKYRLKEGALTFWYELIRIEEFIDDVFATEVTDLQAMVDHKFFVLEA